MRRSILAVAALLLVIAAGATFVLGAQPALAGAPTDTPTPTPTRTATPTRTPTSSPTPQPPFVNTEGTTHEIDVYYTHNIFSDVPGFTVELSVVANPPGCAAPVIGQQVVEAFIDGFHLLVLRRVTWPSACFDLGESIGIVPSKPRLLTVDFSPQPAEHTFTKGAGDSYESVVSFGVVADANSLSPERFSVVTNPPGCPTPILVFMVDENVVSAPPPLSPILMAQIDVRVFWGTPCLNEGESITVRIEPRSLTIVTADLSPPPTPTPTPIPPTPFPAPGISVIIDCDVVTVGVQANCSVPPGTTSVALDLIVFNNTPAFQLGAFGFTINNPDESRLLALTTACDPSGLDCNPDFNQADITGGWACAPPIPVVDESPGMPGQQSSIGCFNGLLNGPTIPSGGSLRVARLTYSIPPGAPLGTVPLTLQNTSVYDGGFGEQLSCAPVITVSGTCINASITVIEAPTLTPTPTATYTNTPPPTDTATPTPEGPAVEKQPEGNANNADLSVPKANLWICETGPCTGPGEGALRVVEHAFGVQDGLGAYEFTVEYDNFVIQSINPCDLVFGPGGAGSTRGPVDELDASAVNTDCAPDPGATNNGTCAYSLVLENLVHFGCVTSGQIPGPTGDFDLASLLLIPHPDLNNDLFPGNDNGVLTVLKDTGCELVDTLGHAVSGSINGGLTPFCRDLAVTVRILEGDLDLDCDVDLTDAQLIAAHYGAFFGGLLYSKWLDLEPALHDLDIDIKDIQKIFGRQGSTCQAPVPAQPPLDPPTPFGD